MIEFPSSFIFFNRFIKSIVSNLKFSLNCGFNLYAFASFGYLAISGSSDMFVESKYLLNFLPNKFSSFSPNATIPFFP